MKITFIKMLCGLFLLAGLLLPEVSQPAGAQIMPGLQYFAGISYFGKFDLTERLNTQYQVGYGHEIPFFADLRMSDAPYAQKVFFNIGIGYTF